MSINNDDKQEIKAILKGMGILEKDIDDMLNNIIEKGQADDFLKENRQDD